LREEGSGCSAGAGAGLEWRDERCEQRYEENRAAAVWIGGRGRARGKVGRERVAAHRRWRTGIRVSRDGFRGLFLLAGSESEMTERENLAGNQNALKYFLDASLVIF
jgi:hypothetical protein